MNNITMTVNADELILRALKEDLTSEDITTNSVMRGCCAGEVELRCKQDGVIAGLTVFQRVFELLDAGTRVDFSVKDGDRVTKGQLLGTVRGDIRVLLSGERTALNFLQRMSGIATYTRTIALFDDFVRELKQADVTVLMEIFAAREQNTTGISSADLAREIPGSCYCATLEDTAAKLAEIARPGDLILTVGAGDIYRAGEMLVKRS